MAFDFPTSPANGTLFQPPGGPAYTWNGTVWNVVSTPYLLVSDTAPASPIDGQLWWQSSTGRLLTYYNDGNTKQWVVAAPQGPPGINGTNGVTGVVLTAARGARRDQIAIPTGWGPTWGVGLGVQVLQIGLYVKSATSKLIVKGGYSALCGGTSQTIYLGLFTSLSSACIGGDVCTQTGSWLFRLSAESEEIAHGQPVGTFITAQMRTGSQAGASGSIINSTSYQNGQVPAWMSLEEVLL
jgi:hypothetical protein